MSYIRFGEDGSSVYIFPSDHGLECCSCPLTGRAFFARTIPAMEQHIADHLAAGQFIPDSVIPEIRADEEWLRAERIIDEGVS